MSQFDTRGLSRDPLAHEPFLDYPAYVESLLEEEAGNAQAFQGMTLTQKEDYLSTFLGINAQAGYAAYVLKSGAGAA